MQATLGEGDSHPLWTLILPYNEGPNLVWYAVGLSLKISTLTSKISETETQISFLFIRTHSSWSSPFKNSLCKNDRNLFTCHYKNWRIRFLTGPSTPTPLRINRSGLLYLRQLLVRSNLSSGILNLFCCGGRLRSERQNTLGLLELCPGSLRDDPEDWVSLFYHPLFINNKFR